MVNAGVVAGIIIVIVMVAGIVVLLSGSISHGKPTTTSVSSTSTANTSTPTTSTVITSTASTTATTTVAPHITYTSTNSLVLGNASATLPPGYSVYICGGDGTTFSSTNWGASYHNAFSSIGTLSAGNKCTVTSKSQTQFTSIAEVAVSGYSTYIGNGIATGSNTVSFSTVQNSFVILMFEAEGGGYGTITLPPQCAWTIPISQPTPIDATSFIAVCTSLPAGSYVATSSVPSASMSSAAYVFH